MTSPEVSIIVPVYKTPISLLSKFCDSIIGQTLRHIEIIFVDDASPDMCPAFLDVMKKSDDRITVIHRNVNGRAGKAREDGLRVATGKYIHFADADDTLQVDMYQTLVGIANQTQADIVSCSYVTCNMNGFVIDDTLFPDRRYDLSVLGQRSKAYRAINYALWNKLYRREVITDLCFEQFEANIGEDTLFNIVAFCRSRIMVTTSYFGYNYIVHAVSATGCSSKGMSYLRTLALSGERIRQAIISEDNTKVGRKFLERLTLKRFITGCGWIAEQKNVEVRSKMRHYWRNYFNEQILPSIYYCRLFALCCRKIERLDDVSVSYRLGKVAISLFDPLSLFDKICVLISKKTNFVRSFKRCKNANS